MRKEIRTPSDLNLSSLISSQQDGQPKTSSEGSEAVVNRILLELKQMKSGWRAAFKSQAEVDGYKEQLLKACIENGINTIEKVEMGLAKARLDESDFLPSVGKFINWCKPEPEHWEHAAIRKNTEAFDKARALPKLRNPDVARKAIENLKTNLGIK